MTKVLARREPPMTAKRARYTLATQFPGQGGYTDSEPTITHLQQLVRWKLPIRSIAADAGMHQESVRLIVNGERHTIRTRHAARLRAVGPHPNPRQGRVLGVGAGRRLRALQVLSWPATEIAARINMSPGALGSLAGRTPDVIDYAVWLAIHDVYEELSGTVGPSKHTRRRAAGRPAPLDWEGFDIDHPEAVPGELRPVKLTRSQRSQILHATVFELREEGMNVEQIARRLGVNERTVERAIAEDRHAASSD